MTQQGEDRHWLQSSVSMWHLLLAASGLAISLVTIIIANESRITRLEVRSLYGTSRNDGQDSEIEKLRQVASTSQVAIGQLNAKLDIILNRQDAVLRALGDSRPR